MELFDILSKVDHTYLKPTATWDDVRRICDEGVLFSTASVCIPPCFVKEAKEYVGEKISVCTVIGFPLGYQTTRVKCLEAEDAILNGADEIDMVINIGDLKSQKYDSILSELKAMREATRGKILKVIIETCLLSDEEKIKMCELVSLSGADFIKTSTGFSDRGASREDIILFSEHIGEGVKIKAAGGISTLQDAEDFIALGASRLGTSRIIQMIKKDGFKKDENSSY